MSTRFVFDGISSSVQKRHDAASRILSASSLKIRKATRTEQPTVEKDPVISERTMDDLLCRKIKTVTCAQPMPSQSKARLLAKLRPTKKSPTSPKRPPANN